MTWSYSGNPAASALDEVRFLIGDVDEAEQLLQDEEITYLLGRVSSTRLAAAEAARAIAARFARQVDEAVGDMRLQLDQRVRHYEALAERLASGCATVPLYEAPSGRSFKIEPLQEEGVS